MQWLIVQHTRLLQKGFRFYKTSMGALCYGNPATVAVFPVGDIGASCVL
jgi:hypothetical protein